MNVLVYSGSEVSQTSLSQTISTLRQLLLPNYTIQPISQQSLSNHPWSTSCAAVVLPSLRQDLLLPREATSSIQSYVENGGSFLALGNAANTSTGRLGLSALSGMSNLTLSNQRALRLVDNHTSVSLSPTSSATGGDEGILTTVRLSDGQMLKGLLQRADDIDLPDESKLEVLGRHTLSDKGTGVAGLSVRIGKGRTVFWNLHLEYSFTDSTSRALLEKAGLSLSSQEASKAEETRLELLGHTLETLGIQLPPRGSGSAHPLPQFLTSTPTKSTLVDQVLSALSISFIADEPRELKDESDQFLFHSSEHAHALLHGARVNIASDDSPSSPQVKKIIVYRDGTLPPGTNTPLFDLAEYYKVLAVAQERQTGTKAREVAGTTWRMGEVMFYGEVVTSTQTMLDKNPRLLSALPTPFLSLASHQLAGRGRGGNVWLSPHGCLQFSLLLRAPLSILPGTRVVFVQYLFALAVVQACRDASILGAEGSRVKLKWPNDIYAELGDGERKKIGGILVNTSFSAGQVDLVIGCGLNVLNPPPITSLDQLIPPDVQVRPTMERTLAAILSKFEGMWATFLERRGSFEPFMDLYLDRWMHSDQLVTLTTTTPPQKVRIVGITSDHGLLRTMPEGGWQSGEFIDLQPDGNSFDIMSGLIRTKA